MRATDYYFLSLVAVHNLRFAFFTGDRPYMTSDGRGGGSAKSDFISKGALIKHLMRGKGGGKKRAKII